MVEVVLTHYDSLAKRVDMAVKGRAFTSFMAITNIYVGLIVGLEVS